MSEETTPEKLFDAYRDAISHLKQEGENMEGSYIPPATYAEVDEQRRRIFEQAAWQLNHMLDTLNDQEILAEMEQIDKEVGELEINLRDTLRQIRKLDGKRGQLIRKLSKQARIEQLFN